MVTGWIQSFYYGIAFKAGQKPTVGSARWHKHRQTIYILTISTYLLYTIYEAHWTIRQNPSFYQLLGVSHNASDREIKSRFRRLAAIYHPDKLNAQTSKTHEDFFRKLKVAQDTLLDPARRFAYDRFGPSVANWNFVTTHRDYISVGMQQTLPYYGAGAVLMYVLGLFGYLQFGTYWRWYTLLCLAVLECAIVSRPYAPRIMSCFINPVITTLDWSRPPYLQFQVIELMRKFAMTGYIALGQVGPMLTSLRERKVDMLVPDEKKVEDYEARLKDTMTNITQETMRLVELTMTPYTAVDKEQLIPLMKRDMKKFLVRNTISNDPMVKDAYVPAIRKVGTKHNEEKERREGAAKEEVRQRRVPEGVSEHE